MIHFKNLYKVLLPFLVLVNLYISFDYEISQESSSNKYNIELIIKQNQSENNAINFEQLKHFFSLDEPAQSYKKKARF